MGDHNVPNLVINRSENITKSQEDKRLYRGLELSNQMKVLLVSDPTTDKSAAALNVNIGSMSDPNEIFGLAHFCEHMLFMGTEKYPNENGYYKYLNEHGGRRNAMTGTDSTTYFFDVIPSELKNVLDRFSQFFIAPLFTASATDREINAVNSEHEKNIPNDVRRIYQLTKHLANSEHPYHSFGTGNKYTLDTLPKKNNINIRDELLKFHNKWYSSNIMRLVVLGKESLEELEETVVSLFANVKNKFVQAPKWEEHPFKEEQLGTCVYVYPVKDIKEMEIIFPCVDLRDYYKSMPTRYISHLIGHEGPGSILSVLKSRGWSNKLSGGASNAARGVAFFTIYVDLTEEGLKHTDEIVELIFQYLNMLKSQGPQKWVQDEFRDINSTLFRFKDKETPINYVRQLVEDLQDIPVENVLDHEYLFSEWKPEIIEKIWNDFTPEKIRVIISGKQFENIVDQVEPWYSVKYKITKISEETLKKWRNAGLLDELKMPERNEFIPSDFHLYQKDKDATQYPTVIKDDNLTRIWFKQDDTFLLPKAKVIFHFVSPLVHSDTLSTNLSRIMATLFKDVLSEYTYAAALAGINWNFVNTLYGFKLTIDGYNHKQHVFLDKIIEKLITFKVDPQRFEVLKEKYIRELKNFVAEVPYQQVVFYSTLLLVERSYSKQELLISAEQMTSDQLQAFIPQVLSRVHVESLIHGNANKEKALELAKIVEERFVSAFTMTPLLPQDLLLNRVLKLEDSSSYVYEIENDVYKESAIQLYYQCGLASKENNIKLELITQILKEPCFDTLRTKEQLGYVVFSGVLELNGVRGLRFIVQSAKHPVYLESRIEEFLKNMLVSMTSMPDEEFLKHKEALAARRLEKPKQLSAQANTYWTEINNQEYHFDRDNVEVDYLKSVTKDDIIVFFKNLIGDKSKFRRTLSIYLVSVAEGGAGKLPEKEYPATTKTSNPSVVSDITSFTTSHEMYPFVQPYLKIARKGYKW